MTTHFADYLPRQACQPREALPAGLAIVPATMEDASGIARLTSEREGISFADALPRALRGLQMDVDRNQLVLTARIGGEVVGFGRARHFNRDALVQSDAPDGWYLMGVIVSPSFRRRGIAAELTGLRLAWIAERAREAFYFANSRNLASIDLHQRFGFVEVRRGISFPGAEFGGGGVGVLFRLALPVHMA